MEINKLIRSSSATGLLLLTVYLLLALMSVKCLLVIASISLLIAALLCTFFLFLMPNAKSKIIWTCGIFFLVFCLSTIGWALGVDFLLWLGFSEELQKCSGIFVLYPFVGLVVVLPWLWLFAMYFMVDLELSIKNRLISSIKILISILIIAAFLVLGYWIIQLGYIH